MAETSLRFSPEGAAKHVTQVRVHFESDVAAIGEKSPPFQADCAFPGQGRYVTTKDWVYDFLDPVPAGHRCSFKRLIKQDLAGKPVAGKESYTFHTGGPQILSIHPNPEYAAMDEEQIFVLDVDSLVSESTLSGRLYFEVPQIANPVPVKLLSFDEVKKANPDFARPYEKRKPQPLFVQAASRLPSGKTIQLVWGKGIESRNGVGSLERQVFSFKTRAAFTVSQSCPRASKGTDCSPFDDIHIQFSAAPSEKAQVSIDGLPKEKRWKREEQSFVIPGPHAPGTVYTIRFQKPFQDDAGRDLSNPADLKIAVGRYPPLIKFQAQFGILEWKGDPRLPVHLRTVEDSTEARVLKIPVPMGTNQNIALFAQWLKKNQTTDLSKAILPDGTPGMEMRKIPKYAGKDKFEVRGLPLTEPGLYQVEISSADLGRAYQKAAMHVHTQALVTDMVIHWKQTRDNQLAWVTSLATGLPVPGATVSIYNCRLQKVGSATTDARGTIFLPVSQTPVTECAKQWPGYDNNGLLITAAKDQDFTFVFNSDDSGIESWRFGFDTWDSYQNPQIHSVLDRSLFRAGETLSALNIARTRMLSGFALPKPNVLPKEVEFRHSGSGKVYKQKLVWDAQGRSNMRWDIPKEASLGSYEIVMRDHTIGTFWVREFQVATVKAMITPATKDAIAPKELTYHYHVNYLNGGSANDLPTTLRAHLESGSAYESETYSDYTFHPITRTEDEGASQADEDETHAAKANELKTVTSKLDGTGQGSATIPLPEISESKTLRVELEYPDANGQLRTQSLSQKVWPANLALGLKTPKNTDLRPAVSYDFYGVALDLKDKPLVTDIAVRRYKKTYLSHRRRSIGGTYTYQSKTLISEETPICSVKSDNNGIFSCSVTFPESGNYLIRAEGKDRDGRKVATEAEVWVEGNQRWYRADDHDRIDLIADKKAYEPGDTAKILVKAPFAKGQILVVTEREGIQSFDVKPFDGKSPYIQVPIARSFAPNIYVSVWLVRGRSKGTEPFLQVDLGKPAFKLGLINLNVGRSKHALSVSVKSDRKEYKPRENAKVSIEVKSPNGALPPEGLVTLAVVDEGLLEIQGNESWNILDAMMGHRAYTGRNASASMQVVGKRHFGLKALPPGGSGGRSGGGSTRELFDTLVHWGNYPIKEGKVETEFALNDSLTGFRIVAVAHAGTDLFGTGETNIQSTKDLSLFSGLPDIVRNGDTFYAEITLRNTTAAEQTVQLQGSANHGITLAPQSVKIGARSSKKVEWTVKVPEMARELIYTIRAESSSVFDEIQIKQKVIDPVPLSTLLGQITQLDTATDIPLALPNGAREGQIKVKVESSLGEGSLEGVRAYMTSYPHTCMEQKLSRAVALGRKDLWDQSRMTNYLDSEGLLRFFPIGTTGSVELTAYALELSYYQGWDIPSETKERMLDALQNFVQGRLSVPGQGLFVNDKIRALSSLALWDRLEPNKKALESLDINPTYLSLPALIDTRRIYEKLDETAQTRVDAALTERTEFRGTVMQFKTDERTLLASADASLSRWILSRLKSNANDTDIPTYVRTLLMAQKRGHWDTTVADALGTLAITAFAKAFESKIVTGNVEAVLGDVRKTLEVSGKAKGFESFTWPKGKTSLTLARAAGSQGSVWVTTLASAAVPLKASENSGIQLTKTLKKVQGEGNTPHAGDIFEAEIRYKTNVRIDWGSLIDPIPPGARILPGTIDATYTEQGFEGIRAYFETVPPGEHTFRYRFQMNTRGQFILPPTRMEAMYAPEVFGMIPNEAWKVE